jgi:thioredoxin 1
MTRQRVVLFALVMLFTLALLFGSGLIGSGLRNAAFAIEKKTAEPKSSIKIPKMLDLGSKSCIPCKKMAPILEELREKYRGKAEIIFVDVREDRAAAAKHRVTLIPTQVFFDTTGKEVYRHVGFFPADSIVAHLSTLGVKP